MKKITVTVTNKDYFILANEANRVRKSGRKCTTGKIASKWLRDLLKGYELISR